MENTKKTSITDLPHELVDAVCQCAVSTAPFSSSCSVDYATLCTLALTFSPFRYAAQRVLFAQLSILISAPPSYPSDATTTGSYTSTAVEKWYAAQRHSGTQLLRTLRSSPRLAGYARKFECRVDHGCLEREKDLGDVLVDVLASMRGLLEFKLALPERLHDGSAASHVLLSVNLPLLRSLSLSFSLDANVLCFLAYTPRLQQLELSPDRRDKLSLSPSEDLPTPHLPALSSFSGSLTDAFTHFSGRMGSLEEMYICRPEATLDQDTQDVILGDIADDVDEEGLLRKLFNSPPDDGGYTSLKTLELHTSLAPLPTLALLASSPITRDVQAMRLVIDPGSAPSAGMDFHHDIASRLTSFPLLTSFNLCGMHWSCSPAPSPIAISAD